MLHVKDCKRRNFATPMKPSVSHFSSCDMSLNLPARPSISRAASIKSPEQGDEDDEAGDDDPTPVTPSGRAVRRNEAERYAYLQADPQAVEIQPFEVLCKTCQKWIKLNNKLRYSLNNWQSHQKRCGGTL